MEPDAKRLKHFKSKFWVGLQFVIMKDSPLCQKVTATGRERRRREDGGGGWVGPVGCTLELPVRDFEAGAQNTIETHTEDNSLVRGGGSSLLAGVWRAETREAPLT